MASCEYCWWNAHDRPEWEQDCNAAYRAELADAERTHAPCQGESLSAQRLRAGQFWDEASQTDSRLHNRNSPQISSASKEVAVEVTTPEDAR